MRKLFFVISSVVLTFFIYGLLLASFSSQVFSKAGAENSHHLFYDYRGITHVVTSHSRGSLSPKDILLQAAQANIDFLFFTDLNPIDKPYSIYGYHGDIFVFSNQKVSYMDAHVLVYSDNSYFHFPSLTDAHAQLTQHFSEPQGREAPYLAVLAHPLKKNHRWQGEYEQRC